MQSLPTFWEDVGRHGLFKAIKKRTSSFVLGERRYKYKDLLAREWPALYGIFMESVKEQEPLFAAWAFEVMLAKTDDFMRCWHTAFEVLRQFPEDRSLPILQALLLYIDDDDWLMNTEHGLWADYLLGRAFLRRAEAARGVNKEELVRYKGLCLHVLGRARKSAASVSPGQAGPPGQSPAALAPLIAAAYEKGWYLQYKGTREGTLVFSE